MNYYILYFNIRGSHLYIAFTLGRYCPWATLGNISLPSAKDNRRLFFMDLKLSLNKDSNISFFNAQTVSLDLEDYISGCVAQEIGNAHIEACKAQAIAARTNC